MKLSKINLDIKSKLFVLLKIIFCVIIIIFFATKVFSLEKGDCLNNKIFSNNNHGQSQENRFKILFKKIFKYKAGGPEQNQQLVEIIKNNLSYIPCEFLEKLVKSGFNIEIEKQSKDKLSDSDQYIIKGNSKKIYSFKIVPNFGISVKDKKNIESALKDFLGEYISIFILDNFKNYKNLILKNYNDCKAYDHYYQINKGGLKQDRGPEILGIPTLNNINNKNLKLSKITPEFNREYSTIHLIEYNAETSSAYLNPISKPVMQVVDPDQCRFFESLFSDLKLAKTLTKNKELINLTKQILDKCGGSINQLGDNNKISANKEIQELTNKIRNYASLYQFSDRDKFLDLTLLSVRFTNKDLSREQLIKKLLNTKNLKINEINIYTKKLKEETINIPSEALELVACYGTSVTFIKPDQELCQSGICDYYQEKDYLKIPPDIENDLEKTYQMLKPFSKDIEKMGFNKEFKIKTSFQDEKELENYTKNLIKILSLFNEYIDKTKLPVGKIDTEEILETQEKKERRNDYKDYENKIILFSDEIREMRDDDLSTFLKIQKNKKQSNIINQSDNLLLIRHLFLRVLFDLTYVPIKYKGKIMPLQLLERNYSWQKSLGAVADAKTKTIIIDETTYKRTDFSKGILMGGVIPHEIFHQLEEALRKFSPNYYNNYFKPQCQANYIRCKESDKNPNLIGSEIIPLLPEKSKSKIHEFLCEVKNLKDYLAVTLKDYLFNNGKKLEIYDFNQYQIIKKIIVNQI